jgi:F-type H+-transporting ATPase subunit delta
MASVTTIYARALVDAVFDRKLDTNRVLQEAKAMVQLAAGSKDLREVFQAPSIPSEQKRKLLDAIVAREGFSREIRNFIAVLIDKRRVQLLAPIVHEFEQELNERMGFAEADIASAHELSDTARRELETQMEKITGKMLKPRYQRDASLLGGAVIRVGSTVYDGSVKGQLERIREQITSAS